MRRRRALPILLAGVLWCGFFVALESYRTVKLYINQPWSDQEPSRWRLGSPPVERLGSFLTVAGEEMPGDAFVILDSSTLPEGERPYLAMWAAYLLPRHQVLPPARELVPQAGYWLVYGDGPEPPAGRPLLSTATGSLYRLP